MQCYTRPPFKALTFPRLALLLSSLLLQACSFLQPKPNELQPLYALNTWSIQGKLGARTPSGGGSGLLTWEETPDRYHLWVAGPLGRGSTEIEGSEQQVTLTTPQGQFTDTSARQLLLTHLGWDFPVQHLRYWVKGLPDPNHASQWQQDEQGGVTGFSQANWQVDLSHYAQVKGYHLPHKIVIRRPDWRFILIIKEWTLEDH